MPVSSALLEGLRKLADLDDATWAEGSKTMTMFFRGCGAAYIADATATSTVPDESKTLDGELVWTIYSHVHSDYKSYIEDEKSGLAAWRKLVARFEKSTMSRRLKARSDFYRAVHDPSLPIDVYINKVKTARKILKGLKCEPGEVETTDVLLINLHSSWSAVRTTITSNKDEQKLDDVIGILNGSTVEPPVKDEDDDLTFGLAASHLNVSSGGRRVGAGGGNSGNSGNSGNGYSGGHGHGHGGGHGSGGGGGGGNFPLATDDKGYHWCDPTNDNHCHRCGRSGHIAARCIHDMPRHIKDWVLGNSPRAHVAAESANEVHLWGKNYGEDDSDDGGDPGDVDEPVRI